MVHKLDASRKTIEMFPEVASEPIIEEEERAPREFKDGIDIDDVAFKWAATGDIQKDSREDAYFVRIAKFKNGYRGVQFVRFKGDNPKDSRNVSYHSCITLTPEQYYGLAQCVFRDSKLIKALLQGHDMVDKIRAFVKGE